MCRNGTNFSEGLIFSATQFIKLPLKLYCPGYGINPNLYTASIEELLNTPPAKTGREALGTQITDTAEVPKSAESCTATTATTGRRPFPAPLRCG